MTALHQAARRGRAGTLELLCAAPGVLVDARDNYGQTPLILASENSGDSEYNVRMLLALGARQELQDSLGMTALHHAARQGHAGVVEQLCAAPGAAAALALRDEDGCTPLARAVRGGFAAIAAVLRAHGAS